MYHLHNDFFLAKLVENSECIIINLKSSDYYQFDSLCVDIISSIINETDINQTVLNLIEQHSLPKEFVENEVEKFIAFLLKEGIILSDGKGP